MRHHGRAGCSTPMPRLQPASPTPARDSDMVFGTSGGVIGAGAFGTALACAVARAGRDVVLYVRGNENGAEMKATRKNPRLPGVALDERIGITDDIAIAARADVILIATPAQNLREAAMALAPCLKPETPVVACAKGIERGTHLFMTEVIAEAIPHAMPAILSGPNFANDGARGLPTAVTLAARDEALASDLAASRNVDMPVSKAVAAILSGKVTIDAAIEGLLTRPFKAEE